jgi:hypothetical protein
VNAVAESEDQLQRLSCLSALDSRLAKEKTKRHSLVQPVVDTPEVDRNLLSHVPCKPPPLVSLDVLLFSRPFPRPAFYPLPKLTDDDLEFGETIKHSVDDHTEQVSRDTVGERHDGADKAGALGPVLVELVALGCEGVKVEGDLSEEGLRSALGSCVNLDPSERGFQAMKKSAEIARRAAVKPEVATHVQLLNRLPEAIPLGSIVKDGGVSSGSGSLVVIDESAEESELLDAAGELVGGLLRVVHRESGEACLGWKRGGMREEAEVSEAEQNGERERERTSETLGVHLDLSGEPVVGEGGVLLSLGDVVKDLLRARIKSASSSRRFGEGWAKRQARLKTPFFRYRLETTHLDTGCSQRKDVELDALLVHLLEADVVDVDELLSVLVTISVDGEEGGLVLGHLGPFGEVLRAV